METQNKEILETKNYDILLKRLRNAQKEIVLSQLLMEDDEIVSKYLFEIESKIMNTLSEIYNKFNLEFDPV